MKKIKSRGKSFKSYKKLNFNFYSEKLVMIQKIATAGVLTLTFIFSLNSYGVVNVFDCSGETNTLEHYNKALKVQNISSTHSYNLGFNAICIGKYKEGLEHMQRASEGSHVAATKVLGSYYDKNQSFDNTQKANIKNTFEAITYYEKAANQIEATSSYPKGNTEDMEYLEYVDVVSYRVFTRLPGLHFNIYSAFIGDTINSGTIHSGTLDILQKLGDAATRCLERPALSVWKEKKERVYKTQQIECQAYLDFVKAIYPLEDERIQIANNCTVSVNTCPQHKEKINQMVKILQSLFKELKKSPGLVP